MRKLFLIVWVMLLGSCDYFKQEDPRTPIARVNDQYLYHDEVADLAVHAGEAAVLEAERLRVLRVDPERVRVRDLLQPLGVGRARVDQRRPAEGRQQRAVARLEVHVAPVHLAADVGGDGLVFVPPRRHGGGVDLEAPTRRREATQDLTVDLYSDRSPTRRVVVGQTHRGQVG